LKYVIINYAVYSRKIAPPGAIFLDIMS